MLVLDHGRSGQARLVGLFAVMAATIAWSVDNTLSRGLADRDPGQVLLGSLLMIAGVVLHLAESHSHPHRHAPVPHAHPH